MSAMKTYLEGVARLKSAYGPVGGPMMVRMLEGYPETERPQALEKMLAEAPTAPPEIELPPGWAPTPALPPMPTPAEAPAWRPAEAPEVEAPEAPTADQAKGRPPRFWMPDAMFDQGLDPHEFIVCAFLCRTAGKSRRCWPALATIAKACRMKRISVIRAVARLEERGMVTRQKRGFRGTNAYTLTPPEQWRAQPSQ